MDELDEWLREEESRRPRGQHPGPRARRNKLKIDDDPLDTFANEEAPQTRHHRNIRATSRSESAVSSRSEPGDQKAEFAADIRRLRVLFSGLPRKKDAIFDYLTVVYTVGAKWTA